MSLPIVLALLAVFGLLAWRRAGLLTWVIAVWLGFYVALRFGFTTPIPSSVIAMYMAVATAALFTYVSSSRERVEAVTGPVIRLVNEPRYRIPLALVLVAIPAAAAANTWIRVTAPRQAPSFGRTVHPAPPTELTAWGKTFDLVRLENPVRALETKDPQQFRARVENGRRVYYQNCVFCHGDDMGGNGMFVHGLDPIPTSFRDPTTIAMLQESFLFWRVTKGGPGMPDEGGPGDSAMPAWEKFLTEDEVWDVITFLYDFTGYRPRAREEVHH